MGMSTGTKRGLAIGLVVIVVAGVGIGAWFLLQPSNPAYQTPGAPAGVPFDRIIKIGILDPMTEIQGDSAWKGAYLAAWEINAAGGVTINGTQYYIGLISEDTKEADALLDVTKGVSAAQKILTVDGAQFLIGGFRTESLKSYIEVVMDKKTLFIHTGASTDYFQQLVLDSYTRYKYCFRIMPINSTRLGAETITELAYLQGYLTAVAGKNITKWAILRENLDWTVPMANALKSGVYGLPHYGWNATPAIEIAYPITAGSSDFATYWSQINASHAQVVIPIISAQGGIYMMTQYNATQPQCLIFGIDVPSQLDTFWASTDGKCRYEIVMQPLVRTNKTALSIPFWDHYKGNNSVSPLYTGVGSYDAVYLYAWAFKNCSSFITDRVITSLEKVNKANPIVGTSGNLAFTRSHDILEGYLAGTIYGVTLWTQWHRDGTKVCVTSGNLLYPNSITTGSIQLPPWGLNT